MASSTIMADQPDWGTDQSDICYLNSDAGDHDGFSDPDAVAANAVLIATAPDLLREVISLRIQSADLLAVLNSWADANNSRPPSGSQDGLMEHKQLLTDCTLLLIATCKRYGVVVTGS